MEVPAWFGERLSQEFPQLQIAARQLRRRRGDLRDAEISSRSRCGRSNLPRPKAALDSCASAAVHQLLFAELVNSDVVVTNSREVHGPVVAEHVMALIFALAKKIPQAARLQQKHSLGPGGDVERGSARPREIAGATLGLIGVGSIGRRVAQMASALGMRVIAVREHVEKGSPEGVRPSSLRSALDEMLQQSDLRRAGRAADCRDSRA